MGHSLGGTFAAICGALDPHWDWYQSLTDDQEDYLGYTIDSFTAGGEEHAKRCAARLPPEPRCPL